MPQSPDEQQYIAINIMLKKTPNTINLDSDDEWEKLERVLGCKCDHEKGQDDDCPLSLMASSGGTHDQMLDWLLGTEPIEVENAPSGD